MKFINEQPIDAEYTEWGVQHTMHSGDVVVEVFTDEPEARFYAGIMEGKVVVRKVYEAAWAECAA